MTRRLKFGFLGCGNMGEAILASLIKNRLCSSREIGITTAHRETAEKLRQRYGVEVFSENQRLATESSTVLLCVKPQQMEEVLKEIRGVLKTDQLIITIAAGLDTRFYNRHLPKDSRLIRAMPNTPTLVGRGATALFAAPTVKEEDVQLATGLFRAEGVAVLLPREELMDAATALSGCGPAFTYLYIQSMIEAAKALGLSEEVARLLTLQTVGGSVEMIRQATESISSLIAKVASKGGTTEAGLIVLKKEGFEKLIARCLEAACLRGKELRS